MDSFACPDPKYKINALKLHKSEQYLLPFHACECPFPTLWDSYGHGTDGSCHISFKLGLQTHQARFLKGTIIIVQGECANEPFNYNIFKQFRSFVCFDILS